jgi:hypothetical protein
MKAAWYEKQGPPRAVLVVGEMPDPIPTAGEVRIRIAASGINPGDTKKRGDSFGIGMAYPRVIPHSDGAGHVDQLGTGFPLNGWAVLYGVTEPSRIVRLVQPRSLRWCPWITLFVSRKECRWSKAPVLAYPASRLIAPFMSQVL